VEAKHVAVRSGHTASQGHALKAQQEAVIQTQAVLGFTLFFEPEVAADSSRLMVPAQQGHAAWKGELERKQIEHDFAAELATVHVVP